MNIQSQKWHAYEKEKRQKEILREQLERVDDSPIRECFAVRIKDWDKPSKLYSLCSECVKTIEPPTKRRNEGVSAVRRCDWCNVRNIL